MENRIPLIVDSSTQKIKELPANDNLDLSSSGIVNTSQIGIGTANATSKLHVIGDVLVSGIVTASNVRVGADISLNSTSGIISATSYRGDGSQLTGVGGEVDITASLFS